MRTIVVEQVRGQAAGWWGSRSGREQVLLAVLGAVLAAALYLALVWSPLQAVRRDAIREIGVQRALQAQLRVAGPALASGPAVAPRGGGTAAVSGSAAELGLNIRRLDPEGERVRVALEDVQFDALVRWVDRLERQVGFRLVDLQVQRRPGPGRVNATLVLEGGE